MKFGFENNLVASYKRLSYTPWNALAEFIDNSTQAYFDNRAEMDAQLAIENERLTIKIDYNPQEGTMRIEDNSIGMDESTLEKAFQLGTPSANPRGRSRYGLGMKTAACWFGDLWTISTKRLGLTEALFTKIDVEKIAKIKGDVNLKLETYESSLEAHGTTITISELHSKLANRTLGAIRERLSAMYRFDFKYGLQLIWNGVLLSWPAMEEKLYLTEEGEPFKQPLDFSINGKRVTGWVGVLGKGHATRKLAGFSIIQNDRLIEDNYKPRSLYGEQEEGSNDLVNQRLIGELYLEQFSVSHTKDKVVWENDEEEQMDKELGKLCAEARELALTLRFRKNGNTKVIAQFKEAAVTAMTKELNSDELVDYLKTVQPNPEAIINTSNVNLINRVASGSDPAIEAQIGSDGDKIDVKIFFNESSEYDPYVLTESTIESTKLLIIINILHPHVQQMTRDETFTNFVRQCIYDGVAEWKALHLRGNIQPNTIKLLKDGLLRIPYEMKTHDGV